MACRFTAAFSKEATADMPVDHFPSTHATWIDAQLTIAEEGDRTAASDDPAATARAADARDALRRHVMERYTDALGAYVSASGLRSAGERDDLVAGFYAGPLSDDTFFRRWRTSGMPLRRWLMNAISFHCRGIRRDAARDRERQSGDRGSAAVVESDAADAFDRAWALSLVNEAYARVQDDLASRGRGIEDEVLRMHVIDGLPYDEVARALGLTRNDCFNATRRVAGRVRDAVRDLLREEGVPESELEAAIAEMLRFVERG
jgi:DNA-directed RNA polymerase specialized sigma24 family protein